MKKFNFLFVAMFVFFATSLNASTADLFSYNEQAISSQMSDLNELETYVKSHEGITLNEMTVAKVSVLNKFDASSPLDYSHTLFGIEDMDWGAFAWGFCCWPIGIFTVILNKNKDSNSKISYLIGVGTWFALSTVSAVVRNITYAATY